MSDLTPAHNERETVHAEIVDGPYGSNEPYAQPNITIAEPMAFVAFVLAVLSFVILPVIGALIALAIAPGAKRRIRESNGQLSGMKLTQAAQVIAIINLLLAAFLIWLLVQIIQWIF